MGEIFLLSAGRIGYAGPVRSTFARGGLALTIRQNQRRFQIGDRVRYRFDALEVGRQLRGQPGVVVGVFGRDYANMTDIDCAVRLDNGREVNVAFRNLTADLLRGDR